MIVAESFLRSILNKKEVPVVPGLPSDIAPN
jgi:hypothetical protein